MFDTLVNRIMELAVSKPEQLAAAFKKERVTYRALSQKMTAVGSALQKMGIARGDRVVFTAVSKPETAAVYLGIQYCGAVAVFADKNAAPENLAAIYENAGAKLLLTDKPVKDYADRCRIFSLRDLYGSTLQTQPAAYRMPGEEDLAELLFTTGTSGEPKGVMLSYRAVYSILKYTIQGTGMREEDRVLIPLPLNHSFALRVMRAALYLGASVILQNGFLFAKEIEQNITAFSCTALAAVPASMEVIRMQMQDRFAEILSRLRYIEVSAGALSLRQRTELTKLLPDTVIYNNWGSSETGGALFLNVSEAAAEADRGGRPLQGAERPHKSEAEQGGRPLQGAERLHKSEAEQAAVQLHGPESEHGTELLHEPAKEKNGVSELTRIEAAGRPLPCIEVRTLDEDGNVISGDRDHPGRMALRGSMLMSGYWNRKELTREVLKDGWLLTGDMVYTDADGYVYMAGRADDMINAGGEKVFPAEIEHAACQCEGVRECACIGVDDPDEIRGQIPVLFVVPGTHYSKARLQKHLSERLERYKLPGQYIELDELPRNQMSKIDKRKLRALQKSRNTENTLVNPVIQTLLTRRSIRKFTGQKISQPVMDMILKTGCYAPSGHNMQSWKFTVLEKEETILRLKDAAGLAAQKRNVYFYGFENPAAVILVSNDERNPYSIQDASCAAENMMLAAWSYGIGSVWVNVLRHLREEEPVCRLLDEFGLPRGHIVWAALALGYPVSEGVLLAKKKDAVHYADRGLCQGEG